MRVTMRSAAVLVLGLVVAPAPLAGQQLTATERTEVVAAIWAEARYNFAFWDRVHADWDSALGANLKLAAGPQSDVLFYRRLRRLLALLADGQAAVIPPPTLRSRIARPPLLVESVERRPLILDYADNDEMRVARPERLAEILTVQGVPAESWIHDSVLPEVSAGTPSERWRRAVQWMLQGEKGTALQLLLRIEGRDERGISVTRSVSLNDRWPLERPQIEFDSLPGGVVVARIGSLADEDVARRFDRAFPDFAGVHGLILDFRHATGGASHYGYEILTRLTNHPVPGARWRTPQYRPVYRALRQPDSAFSWYGPPPDTVSPSRDRPTYAGPIAVLASSTTAGAAEDFLVAFRNAARGVIIGETSAGSPGEPLALSLPKNWAVQLSVTRHAFPNGEELTGKGVEPELPVATTVADVLTGRDPVLERAREYVGGRARP
jgi:carboxyl-terminal processing protease